MCFQVVATFIRKHWVRRRRKWSYFKTATLPPRSHWEYVVPDTINDFGLFLPHAGDLVNEKGGFFTVGVMEGSKRRVRFEWPFDLPWPRGKGRVGLMFACDRTTAEPAEAYFATEAAALGKDMTAPRPITQHECMLASTEIAGMVGEARRRSLTPRSWLVPFSVTVPPNSGVRSSFSTTDGRVFWFSTRFVPGRDGNRRLSPVLVAGTGASDHLARESSAEAIELVRGVAALNSTTGAFELRGAPWEEGEPGTVTAFPKGAVVDEGSLMPPGAIAPEQSELNDRFGDHFRATWDAFHASAKREALLPALGAFVAGREVMGTNPTLGAVAFLAALGSLAHDLIERCPGAMSCSICGSLNSHYRVGDAAAIAQLVCGTLGLTGDTAALIKKTLKTAYSEQRSAFVHQAVFRHNEQAGASISPMIYPGKENERLLEQSEVLYSVERITRAVLLVLVFGTEHRDRIFDERGIQLDRLRARILSMHGIRSTAGNGVGLGF